MWNRRTRTSLIVGVSALLVIAVALVSAALWPGLSARSVAALGGIPGLGPNLPTSPATATATSGAATTTPTTASPSPSPNASPSASPGPPAPPTPVPTRSGWTTVLDDQFTAPGIPAHWELYDAPYGSGPGNCAAPSQDSAPGDGYMYLRMQYLASGNCGAGWYTGGMMISDAYNLTQQAITVRWRIIPARHPSVVFSHHIIPMAFPDDPKYDWYSAEADLCETESYTDCWTFLHDGTANDTSGQVYYNYLNVDLTQWHTWRFEQVNGTLRTYIDNMTHPVWVFTGGTSQFPNAMRRAVLQQECPAAACPPASYAGDTETIQIDWITIQVPG